MSLITSEREHRAEKSNDYTKVPDKSVPLPFTAKHWKMIPLLFVYHMQHSCTIHQVINRMLRTQCLIAKQR